MGGCWGLEGQEGSSSFPSLVECGVGKWKQEVGGPQPDPAYSFCRKSRRRKEAAFPGAARWVNKGLQGPPQPQPPQPTPSNSSHGVRGPASPHPHPQVCWQDSEGHGGGLARLTKLKVVVMPQ